VGLFDFDDRHRHDFDWLQIEVSSVCTAKCVYCPRTSCAEGWNEGLLPLSSFIALRPALRRTPLAHLQGWGEPLLHPDLATMVRFAKDAGCVVSTTSNGALMSERRATALVEAGLDIAAISLAGVDADSHRRWRPGAPFASAMRALRHLRAARERVGVERPRLHVAYMVMRSGLDELEKIPELLADEGVTECVLSSLTLVADPKLAGESVLADDEAQAEELVERVRAVQAEGAKRDVSIHAQLVLPGVRHEMCTENIPRSAVIRYDGGVSPCVLRGLPIEEGHEHDGFETAPPVTFGWVHGEAILGILEGQARKRFVRALSTGSPDPHCTACRKRRVTVLEAPAAG
jgi:MoaA/NifB/PqqE/SkfB family radical SAM enzyme